MRERVQKRPLLFEREIQVPHPAALTDHVHPQLKTVILFSCVGSGVSLVVQQWTRDQKVSGLSPSRSGRRIFFSRVSFLY